jgi:microsomal dipeptidase-like Zn-dependent dipeptidase
MNVTAELISRGYSEEDISKIWSENTIALWRRVDAAAADIQ